MTERIKERLALLKSGTYKSVRRKLEEKTVNLPEGTDGTPFSSTICLPPRRLGCSVMTALASTVR